RRRRMLLVLERRAELVEQEACALLARARVVIAVKKGTLLGDREPRPRALRLELDRSEGDRDLPLIQMHLIDIDEPFVWHGIQIACVESGHRPARPASPHALASARADIHRALEHRVPIATRKPAGLGSLVR